MHNHEQYWLAPELVRAGKCSEASEVYSMGSLAKQILPPDSKYPWELHNWVYESQHYHPYHRPTLQEGIEACRDALVALQD
ncbi:hypothetical protein Hamer_G001445 [Homarus americanus]|uniref:Uncharacterized protein n=1 Tax=Homarus americanus TaxID=6706 RepID=A0A8J5N9L3_HOMAM|nr:hypothetical protein Hamer_G001445 [Homarus americanus]